MNKKEKTVSFKNILKAAREIKAVSEQNLNIAERLESEAISALKLLGATEGQARKSKYELSPEEKITLLGGLTK